MKFSVLLPTRNRLEYLRYAVETVRRQDYDDWELIISDNDSDEDIAGYAASLNEPRIKYVRTASFIPVTDNWNNALNQSTGEYVIMLGDDDCLMQGYFRTIADLAAKYDRPDFIYTSANLYAYPGVMPAHPDGYLQPYGYATFFDKAQGPALLERGTALSLVKAAMDFRVHFGFNMQFSAIHRRLINTMREKGEFFQSPYPDYYAMNVMMLKADKIVTYPYPMVTIGVTPKSFGFYYFNRQEAAGDAFLNNLPDPESAKRLAPILLPGTTINTCWLFAMEAIKANYGGEFDLKINYRRYRFLQMVSVYKGYYIDKQVPKEQMDLLNRELSLWERMTYGTVMPLFLRMMAALTPERRKKIAGTLHKVVGQFRSWQADKADQKYGNILEVFEQVKPLDA